MIGTTSNAYPQFVLSPREASSDVNLRRISFTSTSSTKPTEHELPVPTNWLLQERFTSTPVALRHTAGLRARACRQGVELPRQAEQCGRCGAGCAEGLPEVLYLLGRPSGTRHLYNVSPGQERQELRTIYDTVVVQDKLPSSARMVQPLLQKRTLSIEQCYAQRVVSWFTL